MENKNYKVQLNRESIGIRRQRDGSTLVIKDVKKGKMISQKRPLARRNKIADQLQKNSRKYVAGSLRVGLLITIATIVATLIMGMFPYVISVGDRNVCYVDSKEDAQKAITILLEGYVPEGADIKAVDAGGELTVERIRKTKPSDGKILSSQDAAEALMADYQREDNPADITIASAITELKAYTPKPNYEKDDTMLAGESKILKEGKDGTQKVTTTYISVNGKVTKSDVTSRAILDEGEKATVAKGTLGLPEGEDWTTFEGDPVFKNGDELGTTALQYLGAPYKYGGTSLTNGIDCVQFVRQMYAKYGIHLSNSDVYHGGKSVSLKNAKRGDIICYNHHVAIYLGDGKVVHALKKGVSTSNVNFRKVKDVRRIVQ